MFKSKHVVLASLLCLSLALAGCEAQLKREMERREWIAECIKSRPADSGASGHCNYLQQYAR